jgi:hypothetical protein
MSKSQPGCTNTNSRTSPTPAPGSPAGWSSSVAVGGIADKDPTGTAALDPRRSQIRRAARRAALLIEQAELTLEEASGVIANGYLRLDPQEWVRAI